MKRNIDLKEISDGKLYLGNDLVKADCGGCNGCSACCKGMGTSIVLDPYDVHQMMNGLGLSFEELLAGYIELNVVDGLILPNLQMKIGAEEACAFLDDKGRCNIHSFRPGICRLFPLGRFYEEGTHKYFLQIHECANEKRTKIKVKKWLGIDHLKEYESYVDQWHNLIRELGQEMEACDDEEHRKKTGMILLQFFYIKPYGNEFFHEFKMRCERL